MYPRGQMIIKAQSKEESLDIARNLLTQLGLHEAESNDQKHNKTLKR